MTGLRTHSAQFSNPSKLIFTSSKFWFSSIISSNNFRNSFASWKHSCWLGLCSCTKQHFCLTFGHATQTKGFHRRHFVYIVSSGGMRNIETWKSLFQTSSCICACYHFVTVHMLLQMRKDFTRRFCSSGSSTNIAFWRQRFHDHFSRETTTNAQEPSMTCFLFSSTIKFFVCSWAIA